MPPMPKKKHASLNQNDSSVETIVLRHAVSASAVLQKDRPAARRKSTSKASIPQPDQTPMSTSIAESAEPQEESVPQLELNLAGLSLLQKKSAPPLTYQAYQTSQPSTAERSETSPPSFDMTESALYKRRLEKKYSQSAL